jgi:lipopolysaccharide transport system permease protein
MVGHLKPVEDCPLPEVVLARLEEVRVEPPRGWTALHLAELWEYRELAFFLARRDVSVLYRQTALGVAWAVIQPVFYMLVFSVLFGRVARLPSDGLPYPLFTLAGLLPWNYFAAALVASSQSLVASQGLFTKVYFPRLVIPFSSVLPGLVDFAVAFLLLLVMMVGYGVWPGLRVLCLPAFMLLALVTASGIGLWLSALNVQYRDVRYAVPVLVQFWFWCSPVAYSAGLLSERWRLVYGLNPMAGVIQGFRWALLGSGSAPGPIFAVSVLGAVLLLVSGAFFFQRMEKTFADVV